ncbi:MAG: hypothetical protein M1834_006761 [Cirrosporium novae-zelandiae]|nr:MAG: hypothetical protein M1834_006761 [Cirrosporium novae-zelandiae]
MMLDFHISILLAGALALFVATSITTAVIYSVLRKNTTPCTRFNEHDELYEDEDGIATEESQHRFSQKWQKAGLTITCASGSLCSLATAILWTLGVRKHTAILELSIGHFLNFATWICLSVQTCNLWRERQPTQTFTWGVYGSLTALVLAIALCVQNAYTWSVSPSSTHMGIQTGLFALQFGSAVLFGLIGVLIPRRPNIFWNGIPVDQQFTVSAASKLTFNWAFPILKFAKEHKRLTIDDLPTLDHWRRSDFLQRSFHKKGKLWKSIVFCFAGPLVSSLLVSMAISIVQFGPQLMIFNILKCLEINQTRASAWIWVVGLGICMLIHSFFEAWLFWLVWESIGIPVRQQLSALVSMKAMRRKDVKGAKKTETRQVTGSKTDLLSGEEEDDEDQGTQKTRQGTVNLIGIDAKRVCEFCAYYYLLPLTAAKLVVSFTFLCSIIGLIPLLAGLSVSVLVTPINWLCASRYAAAQGSLMKIRDSKLAVVNEALQGIRQIKFSALEQQWQEKISERRQQELKTQWKVYKMQTCLDAIWILGPIMLSAVSLSVYSLMHGSLSASVAFTTIGVFATIETSLAIIPEFITDMLDARISSERIEKYLNSPEKTENTIDGPEVEFNNASIAWPADNPDEETRFVLRDVNLKFPSEKLSVISGKTGTGKSLLIASILGECDILTGTVKVPKISQAYDDSKATKANWIIPSAIAFVSQQPWIENATIRDNILFALPFDEQRYSKVLSACALAKDLQILPDGDVTDIGANGVNLSGGQKWRVSLARALYSRAGILVLDDIFSAVDAHVGRHLFEQALTGELALGRTRIIVTHHVHLCLPRTDYSVLLGEGTIESAGSVNELGKTGLLGHILEAEREGVSNIEEEISNTDSDTAEEGLVLQKVISTRSARSHRENNTDNLLKPQQPPKKFVEDEARETGSIKLHIYKVYIRATGGIPFWLLACLFFVTNAALSGGRSWWIAVWTKSYQTESASVLLQSIPHHYHRLQEYANLTLTTVSNSDLGYYLSIYVLLSILMTVIGTLKYFIIYWGGIKAARILFEQLTYTVLRAPLRWLDTVPVGRILNRFTTDFNVVDSRLPNDLGYMLYFTLNLLLVIITSSFVSPFVVLMALALVAICGYVATYYLAGAREIKRLESNAKSPIFEQFNAALTGLTTIRAFGKAERYIERMFTRIDDHSRAFWHLWLFNRWLQWRLQMVGITFAMFVAASVVWLNLSASLSGFALSFALQFTSAIVFTLRMYANLELDMNSCERVVDYSTPNLPIEDHSGQNVPAAWPSSGNVEVENLVVGYADDLPPVLKGLTFAIESNQRIGVVGRTGAGKSSLTLALFRFLGPYREGTVTIDGIDISKIKLHDLRSRLAIIPQDPVLFSGTVRSNLDPFDRYSDVELRDALERVHLIRSSEAPSRDEQIAGPSGSSTPTVVPSTSNSNIFADLTSAISEGGQNLSQGQRQLLCLARAIVARPKIMFLDEATSAVSFEQDILIQRSIREEFKDSTLMVIAHRLSTICDFDKILVMGEGKVLEYGTPRELMEMQGEFWGMVNQSGEKERLEEMILGK